MILHNHMKHYFLYLLLAAGLMGASCQSSKQQESQQQATVQETEEHDCATCGMPTQEYPEWAASLTSGQGEEHFCSSRCMFSRLQDTVNRPQDITALQVTDYYDNKPIDARKAFYVIGSDQMGPMGPELIPFAQERAASEFMKDHAGKRMLRFEQVDATVLQQAMGM